MAVTNLRSQLGTENQYAMLFRARYDLGDLA